MVAPFRWLGLLCLVALPSWSQTVDVHVAPDGLTWPGGAPLRDWLTVRDLAAGDAYVPVPTVPDGERFRGSAAGLAVDGAWRAVGDGAELTCTVTATPPADRAFTVRVALPLDATGWRWWDDLVANRTIEAGKAYRKTTNWGGRHELSAYPIAAVTSADAGYTLAVPVDDPRLFRFTYSGERRALEAEFDLGLTTEPMKVPCTFRLLVTRCDPAWGFRDAWRWYTAHFASLFTRRVPEGGIWLLGLDPTTMVCPWDYGFRFDEGAERRTAYDAAHDILSYVYTEPWGKYLGFGNQPPPDHKPRHGANTAILSLDALKQKVTEDAASPDPTRRGWAQAVLNSAIEDPQGHWTWLHWTDEWSKDNWLSNVLLNPDPDLPAPNRATATWQYELDPAFALAKQNGAELSGVYLDSISGFIGFSNDNFRREHWRYADIPLVASTQAKAPAELHAFSNVEFNRQVSERMWAAGHTVIGNHSRPELLYFSHLSDMLGAGEPNGLGIAPDEHCRYLRLFANRKPMSWMAYGFVNPQLTWEEKQKAFERCLFYAIHPGTGGFSQPASYEPSRPLYRIYEPLITWLDAAGWQPVTGARTDTPNVLIERYGPTPTGVTFLALRNTGDQATLATVKLDPMVAGSLPPDWVGWQLVSDTALVPARHPFAVNLGPDRTEVVALGTRQALAGLWLERAHGWLNHTAQEARWLAAQNHGAVLNGGFEQGLAGWGTDQQNESTITLEEAQPLVGKRSMRAEAKGPKPFQALHQNVTLPAGNYQLHFQYRWSRPAGATGTVTPRLGVKGPDGQWAEAQYVYFRDLPPSDQTAVYDRAVAIPQGYSIGYFQFLLSGNWGTFLADDLQLTPLGTPDSGPYLEALAQTAEMAARQWPQPDQAAINGGTFASWYNELHARAQQLTEPFTQRCLLSPIDDFAVDVGHAMQVLGGVSTQLGEPGELTTAAAGSQLQLTVRRVGIEPQAGSGGTMTVPLPAQAATGWQDALYMDQISKPGQALWITRRKTVFLRDPVSVEAAQPASPVRPVVPLAVRSWLPAGTAIGVSAGADLGGPAVSCGPVTVTPPTGGTATVDLTLPPEAAARLAPLAASGQPLKLNWRAEGPGVSRQGELSVPVVRGAQCPALAAPTLDGRVDPQEWAQAARLEGFVTAAGNQPSARATTVYLGHDATTLYLAFVCAGQAQPVAAQRARDGAVWEDDAVELFLQPPGVAGYYHLAVNAAGSLYDARAQNGLDASWNGTWTAVTGRQGDGWTAEVALPLATLGGRFAGTWRANFCREEADTKAATCWAPTFGGFHSPERFGVLVF